MCYIDLYQYRLVQLMQFLNIRNQKYFIYLVFSIILLIGINIYRDYGITIDDEFYRQNGEFYLKYIKILFSGDNLYGTRDLEKLSQKILGEGIIINHPVLFELLLAITVNIFDINETKEIYEISHLLNFLIFYLSLIFFYKLIFKRFNSKNFALLSVIFLFFSPRIFAESFYNSRDIFFLSLFILNICSGYLFIQKQNFNTAILFSLTSGLLISAKIFGLVPPILLLFFYFLNNLSEKSLKKDTINFILFISFSTIIFTYIFWPYLWMDPFRNIFNAFKDIVTSQHNVYFINLYLGEYISTTNAPWHYRIVWFFFTTPVSILFLFIIGFILLFLELSRRFLKVTEKNQNLWDNTNQMFDYYLLSIFVLIIFLTIKFNTSQFGGWRHLYFLYPLVIFFSMKSLKYILNILFNSKVKFILYGAIILNFSYIFFWSYNNHPHQNVYFNVITKNYAKNNFALDYWGVSHIHSLRHIIKKNLNKKINIASTSFTRLEDSILMLDEGDKRNIILTPDIQNADFLIDNYMKRIRNNFEIDKKKYSKFFEIFVNDVPISTVYKKIN